MEPTAIAPPLLAVDLERRGETRVAGLAAGILQIAVLGVAGEVEQVDGPLGVDNGLGLNAGAGVLTRITSRRTVAGAAVEIARTIRMRFMVAPFVRKRQILHW